MIVGGGKWSAQAAEDIAAFCEANELPVTTAFRRQDYVDNRSRVFAGHVGVGIDPALATRVTEADLLLVVGPRLGEMTTGGYTLVEPPLPRQTLVHVHAGAEELGRVYQPALAIHAGSPEFAAAAREACVSETQSPARRAWVEGARADYLKTLEPVPSPGTLNMSEVMAVLRERLPEDTIVCNGAGNFAVWPHRFWQYTRYRTQLAPTSGAMGYGVPAAIAAKIVEPERTVVCFAGDGDFLMSGQELATAVQERADVLFLVVDNGMFGTIRMHQEREYPGRVVGTSLTNPDFAAFAASFGVHGARVERTEELAPALERALAAGGPALLHLARRPGGDHSSHNSYGGPGGHGRPRANRDRMRLLPALALAALALAGCGSDDGDNAAPPAATVPPEATGVFTVTEAPPTTPADTTPEGEGACSMSGVRLTLPEQDLPPAVADVRKRVFDAAVACDYDTLEQIALEKGAGFTFSYGSGTDASEYWRDLEENSTATPKPMRALADDPDAALHPQRVRLLRLAHRLQREPDRGRLARSRLLRALQRRGGRPDEDAGHGLPRLPHRDHARRGLAVLRRRGLTTI